MRRLLLLSVVLFTGCLKSPIRTTDTDNHEIPVHTLFTDADGYTVKRFEDNGPHYYVVPSGHVEKNWTEQQGKTTIHKQETIQTLQGKK